MPGMKPCPSIARKTPSTQDPSAGEYVNPLYQLLPACPERYIHCTSHLVPLCCAHVSSALEAPIPMRRRAGIAEGIEPFAVQPGTSALAVTLVSAPAAAMHK